MRLNLSLEFCSPERMLTLNYQYPFSAAIYKVIERADGAFAEFLHEKGYGGKHKQFKLFTFSDLRVPFSIRGDRLRMLSDKVHVTVCFHVPEAAQHFMKGLFLDEQIDVGDQRSRVSFRVKEVQLEESFDRKGSSEPVSVVVQPLSPIVVGRKNDRGYYDYRSPEDTDFADCLLHNWVEKFRVVSELPEDVLLLMEGQVRIEPLLYAYAPNARLVTIKAGTPEQTRIKGYTKFKLRLVAPAEMLEVAFNAGLGLYNSQGMGCLGRMWDM